ncbi:MAG: PAS domain S-box protein, partial [Haloplanus sp.]
MSDQRLGVDTGFLADLTRLVSGGVLVVDDGGDLVWADDDARDLFGLDRGGDSVPDVFDADGEWLAPDERPYMRAFETGEPIHDLSCRASVDGARRPVTVDAVPLTDRDGVSRVALAVDVDDAFDEPASELDEVLERIDDAFIALDTDWRFTYVNGRAEELLERSAADLLGTNIWDAFSEAVGTTFQEQYERAMETQEPVAFDEYYPPLDEWFEVRAYPSETGLSVYFKDITDRKERERELERYESIVETTDDGVYVVDESGRFTMVNEAYADLVGYSRDELVGAPRSKVVSDEVVERADEIHRELRETDTDTARLEAELETAAGETITAEATFSLVEQGDETRRVGVVRDVTERKERER